MKIQVVCQPLRLGRAVSWQKPGTHPVRLTRGTTWPWVVSSFDGHSVPKPHASDTLLKKYSVTITGHHLWCFDVTSPEHILLAKTWRWLSDYPSCQFWSLLPQCRGHRVFHRFSVLAWLTVDGHRWTSDKRCGQTALWPCDAENGTFCAEWLTASPKNCSQNFLERGNSQTRNPTNTPEAGDFMFDLYWHRHHSKAIAKAQEQQRSNLDALVRREQHFAEQCATEPQRLCKYRAGGVRPGVMKEATNEPPSKRQKAEASPPKDEPGPAFLRDVLVCLGFMLPG